MSLLALRKVISNRLKPREHSSTMFSDSSDSDSDCDELQRLYQEKKRRLRRVPLRRVPLAKDTSKKSQKSLNRTNPYARIIRQKTPPPPHVEAQKQTQKSIVPDTSPEPHSSKDAVQDTNQTIPGSDPVAITDINHVLQSKVAVDANPSVESCQNTNQIEKLNQATKTYADTGTTMPKRIKRLKKDKKIQIHDIRAVRSRLPLLKDGLYSSTPMRAFQPNMTAGLSVLSPITALQKSNVLLNDNTQQAHPTRARLFQDCNHVQNEPAKATASTSSNEENKFQNYQACSKKSTNRKTLCRSDLITSDKNIQTSDIGIGSLQTRMSVVQPSEETLKSVQNDPVKDSKPRSGRNEHPASEVMPVQAAINCNKSISKECGLPIVESVATCSKVPSKKDLIPSSPKEITVNDVTDKRTVVERKRYTRSKYTIHTAQDMSLTDYEIEHEINDNIEPKPTQKNTKSTEKSDVINMVELNTSMDSHKSTETMNPIVRLKSLNLVNNNAVPSNGSPNVEMGMVQTQQVSAENKEDPHAINKTSLETDIRRLPKYNGQSFPVGNSKNVGQLTRSCTGHDGQVLLQNDKSRGSGQNLLNNDTSRNSVRNFSQNETSNSTAQMSVRHVLSSLEGTYVSNSTVRKEQMQNKIAKMVRTTRASILKRQQRKNQKNENIYSVISSRSTATINSTSDSIKTKRKLYSPKNDALFDSGTETASNGAQHHQAESSRKLVADGAVLASTNRTNESMEVHLSLQSDIISQNHASVTEYDVLNSQNNIPPKPRPSRGQVNNDQPMVNRSSRSSGIQKNLQSARHVTEDANHVNLQNDTGNILPADVRYSCMRDSFPFAVPLPVTSTGRPKRGNASAVIDASLQSKQLAETSQLRRGSRLRKEIQLIQLERPKKGNGKRKNKLTTAAKRNELNNLEEDDASVVSNKSKGKSKTIAPVKKAKKAHKEVTVPASAAANSNELNNLEQDDAVVVSNKSKGKSKTIAPVKKAKKALKEVTVLAPEILDTNQTRSRGVFCIPTEVERLTSANNNNNINLTVLQSGRPQRTRVAPVAYWTSQKVIYGFDKNNLPTVLGVSDNNGHINTTVHSHNTNSLYVSYRPTVKHTTDTSNTLSATNKKHASKRKKEHLDTNVRHVEIEQITEVVEVMTDKANMSTHPGGTVNQNLPRDNVNDNREAEKLVGTDAMQLVIESDDLQAVNSNNNDEVNQNLENNGLSAIHSVSIKSLSHKSKKSKTCRSTLMKNQQNLSVDEVGSNERNNGRDISPDSALRESSFVDTQDNESINLRVTTTSSQKDSGKETQDTQPATTVRSKPTKRKLRSSTTSSKCKRLSTIASLEEIRGVSREFSSEDGINRCVSSVDVNETKGITHMVRIRDELYECYSSRFEHLVFDKPSAGIELASSIDDTRFATGFLRLQPGITKSIQKSTNFELIYFLLEGKVLSNIHTSSRVILPYEHFFVPSDVNYEIKNLSTESSLLAFYRINIV